METRTYELLECLYQEYGPREFGKLCQKLLAISFQMAGYSHIVERGVQGVDIDAAGESGEKYAVEVKTTASEYINIEPKDVDGLKKRKKDGYQPVLAALRLDRFSDWILAKADEIEPRRMYIDRLRAYRLPELEERIRPLFNKAVEEHFNRTMQDAQKYLDDVLRQKGVEVRQS